MTALRVVLLLALALVAAILSGCVVFLAGQPTASQRDAIGSVEIRSVICASDASETQHAGCGDDDAVGGDSGGNSDGAADHRAVQLLVAYRVPAGSRGPTSFRSDAGPGTLTFRQSPSFRTELTTLAPPGAARQWIAYISDRFEYDPDADPAAEAHRLTLSPEFTLPPGAGGAPFTGPFRYRATVGVRESTTPADSARPVDCGGDLFGLQAEGEAVCVDSPSEDTVATDAALATRDLAIVPAPGSSVVAGEEASLPFSARFAGPSGPRFAVTASTTVPGAQAVPVVDSFGPGTNGSTPLAVRVMVPETTPPGDYAVSLTARYGNAQARTAQTRLTVGPEEIEPRVTATLVKGQRVRSLLRGGLRVRLRASEPARVGLRLLQRKRLLGRRTTRFSQAGSKTVRIPLSRKARRKASRARLLRPRRLKLALRSTAVDLAGNRRVATKRLALRR